ncbi:MAG: serine hydrolase, partial [Acidobacteria bacterium]|nr:serine hydrolase [Acidobacteriota bacterium]
MRPAARGSRSASEDMLLSPLMALMMWLLLWAAGLPETWSGIAADVKGRTGVCAVLLETGERHSLRGGERFPMQSVYKLPIAMAVLAKVDAGALTLEQKVRVTKSDFVTPKQHSPIRDMHPHGGFDISVRELLRYAVSESDGSASDVLLRLLGGPGKVQAYLAGLGVEGVRVADTEKAIGTDDSVQYRNWATPESAVLLLSR